MSGFTAILISQVNNAYAFFILVMIMCTFKDIYDTDIIINI